jgi:hypothetical protein
VTYAGQFGAWPTLSGFTTELFPAAQRALARSAAGAASVTGQCGSFLLATVLVRLTGSLPLSVAALAAGPLSASWLPASRKQPAGNWKKPRQNRRQAGVPAIEPAHGAAPLYDGRGQLCTVIRRFPGHDGDDEHEVGCWA